MQYLKADEYNKKKIVNLYLDHTTYINNWDLVDFSAYHILGDYLFDKEIYLLYTLAKSKILWERRIAIIATFFLLETINLKIQSKFLKYY